MARRAALLLAACAGCFSPRYDSNQFTCLRAEDRCPPAYHCAVDLTCWKDGSDPETLGPPDEVVSVGLTTGRRGHLATVAGSSLWVVGGAGSSGTLTSVERARIRGDGSLETFGATQIALATPRTDAAGLVFADFFWVIGGRNGQQGLRTVERSAIQSVDGTLGPFSQAVLALSAPRSGHTVDRFGGQLAAIGGFDGNGVALDSVEQAPDDATRAFAPTGSRLAVARGGHAVAAVDAGTLYVIGGSDGIRRLDSIERATVAPDGTVGPFSVVPDVVLHVGRSDHTVAVVGRLIYVFGGLGRDGPNEAALNSVERCTVRPDGSITPFELLPDRLTRARLGHTSTPIGRNVYLVGGDDRAGFLRGVERATTK